MAESRDTVEHIRFRMSGMLYRKTLRLLAEGGNRTLLLGSCGWTRSTGPTGPESVACLHTVAEQAFRLDGSNAQDHIPFGEDEGEKTSWPVILYNERQGDEWVSCQAERLFNGHEMVLTVAISGNGELYGHALSRRGWDSINSIMVAGSDILLWATENGERKGEDRERTKRFEQAFGSMTKRIMSHLRIGVVGVSGTGSPVAEMLYRLGVGELVLVDNDSIETKNLGRIYNSSTHDADLRRLKVDVIGDALERNGLPTRVRRIAGTTQEPMVLEALAHCDILFGCMDTESGRAILNRLATFYLIPYFDIGVNLKADGQGGISVVCGAVHYLLPGGSSLLSRRAIVPENIEAEDLKRANPEMYKQRVEEKYIKGVVEERPAVITVNTLVASLALNDFLARIHPYRRSSNAEIGCIRVDLREPVIHYEDDGAVDEGLARWAGYGDVEPLLRMPAFSKGVTWE